MNLLSVLELQSWQDVAALIGSIAIVQTAIAASLVLWLNTKYVSKPHFYATKDETKAVIELIDGRVSVIERAQVAASAPIQSMQYSVNEMKEQLARLTEAVSNMKDSVGQALHDIDKRTSLIEATGGRKRSSSEDRT